MIVDDDGPAAPSVEHFPLGVAVADLYADLRVDPLLRRLLTHSRGLLGTVAGSVSVVDAARGHYNQIAENGVACRLGQSFPLDEGATGQAVARRRPVIIDDYSGLRGHLPPDHPASKGAAAAVPLWWRGEVIGVNVAFAGRRRRFTTAEVDALELLTQSVAAAVVKAGAAVPALAGLLREREGAAVGALQKKREIAELAGEVARVEEQLATISSAESAVVRVTAQICGWSGSSSANRPSTSTGCSCRRAISRRKWAKTESGSATAAAALMVT